MRPRRRILDLGPLDELACDPARRRLASGVAHQILE
jgi:hypothetical protein